MDPPAPTLFALLITPVTIPVIPQYHTIPAWPPTGILSRLSPPSIQNQRKKATQYHHKSHIKRQLKLSMVSEISIRVNVSKREVY